MLFRAALPAHAAIDEFCHFRFPFRLVRGDMPEFNNRQSITAVRSKKPDLIDNVGSGVISKMSDVFNVSAGEPTMLYYSIFQQLFKFIPRYRFDKKAEETSGNR